MPLHCLKADVRSSKIGDFEVTGQVSRLGLGSKSSGCNQNLLDTTEMSIKVFNKHPEKNVTSS